MKESWFFFPLGYFFRALGGIPVRRKNKKGSLTEELVKKFGASSHLQIAITPEGTRKRTAKWHTGFLQISVKAGVPCVLGAIDAKTKSIYVNDVFFPTGDIEKDMRDIKHYYSGFTGIYPEKFTTEES